RPHAQPTHPLRSRAAVNPRRLVLSLCGLVGCSGGVAPPEAPPAPAPRPSGVLITLDTTRADHLGSYGRAEACTRTLDAPAARRGRSAAARSVMPLTLPSPASLFPGLYPPHHGVRGNNGAVLDPRFTTLAEVLRDNGWRTAASVGAFVTQPLWGFDQGF